MTTPSEKAPPEKDPAAATSTAQSTEAASKTPSTKTDWKTKFLELEAKLKAQTETNQVQSPPLFSSKPEAPSAPRQALGPELARRGPGRPGRPFRPGGL